MYCREIGIVKVVPLRGSDGVTDGCIEIISRKARQSFGILLCVRSVRFLFHGFCRKHARPAACAMLTHGLHDLSIIKVPKYMRRAIMSFKLQRFPRFDDVGFTVQALPCLEH